MPLRKVLSETDAIVLVEISENKRTSIHRTTGEGHFGESIEYTNDIKARVISAHVGEFRGAEFDTKYSLTLRKGVRLVIPGFPACGCPSRLRCLVR